MTKHNESNLLRINVPELCPVCVSRLLPVTFYRYCNVEHVFGGLWVRNVSIGRRAVVTEKGGTDRTIEYDSLTPSSLRMHVTRGSTHKEWLARTLTSWPADCSVAVVAVHSVEEVRTHSTSPLVSSIRSLSVKAMGAACTASQYSTMAAVPVAVAARL